MATEYRPFAHLVHSPNSTFAQIRDSFYLFSVLNQYTFNPGDWKSEQDLERLLRFTLFDPSPETADLRRHLATSLRRQRRRGVVQVMVTLFWYVVVFIISIHQAFGELGDNALAHDLALGLLLGWFPILLASTITDRNPTDTLHTRRKLNSFLLTVQKSNPDTFLRTSDSARENVFGDFAGQDRRRWHYGAAHCILNALEDDFLKDAGRNWHSLYTPGELMRLSYSHGLLNFDIRQL
jgi:hypothetical protein